MRRMKIAIRPQPPEAPLPDVSLGVAVILPAYNEEAVIARTVADCLATLAVIAPEHEVIVVDDGSTDRTGEIADALAAGSNRVRVIHNRPNRGYGGALVAGFEAASMPLVFFMDSDGQFSISDLGRLLPFSHRGYRAVLGYREHRQDPPQRLLMAWAWNRLVSTLFHIRVRDVDCAFKIYDRRLLLSMEIQARGAMINTEMLAKLVRLDVEFVEVPVRHHPRLSGRSTGGDPRVIVRAFGELLRLRGQVRRWSAAPSLELTGTSSRATAPATVTEVSLRGHGSLPMSRTDDLDAAS